MSPSVLSSLLSEDSKLLAAVYACAVPRLLRYINSAVGGVVALCLLNRSLAAAGLLTLPAAAAVAVLVAKYARGFRV